MEKVDLRTILISLFLILIFILGIYQANTWFNGSDLITNIDNKNYIEEINKTSFNIKIENIIFENITPINKKSEKNEINFQSLTGNWIIDNEIYKQTSIADAKESILSNIEFENYSLSVKIKVVSLTGSIQGIALLTKYNKNDFYKAQIRPDISMIYLVKQDSNIINSAHFNANLYQWHTLEVIHFGNSIKILFDNDPLIDTTDSEYTDGNVGLQTYNAIASFSDITITNLTNSTSNLLFSYKFSISNISKLTLTPSLFKKQFNPSGSPTYSKIYNFPSINYTSNASNPIVNDSIPLSFPSDLIRPPDIIYFPTEPYQNRTFTIRLIARGWDDEKQEWVFKEFMSPEFTWEDVVEGRTITADGSRQ